ncbi:VapC toxin family PIN domain ribonuclease [Chitinimonas sp. BJB300]|nr:VapC toxin family PIN domain ribonuclease [Chitinimonas sp. BJB300]TSJ85968.1 type II toxin-antitoxin system VapC family toxin [Chitinimonas sp. BJB300]
MLDTNMVSHIIKGSLPAVREKLVTVPMAQVCISAITEGELRFGVAKRPDSPKLHAAIHEFLLRVDTLPWDSAAAESYGELRASLERAGKPLGNLDMLIAAHAMAASVTLITNDKAFLQVKGLQVEDWSK